MSARNSGVERRILSGTINSFPPNANAPHISQTEKSNAVE
jgi:hypothetical protein